MINNRVNQSTGDWPSHCKAGSALQEADSVMGDIRLQLARYAQGIHWVQKNFLLDESIRAVLVTAGHMDLLAAPQKPGAGFPDSSQAAHMVLQMQPQFDVPFPAPESWNQQVPFPTCCLLSKTSPSFSQDLTCTFKSHYTALESVIKVAASVLACIGCICAKC